MPRSWSNAEWIDRFAESESIRIRTLRTGDWRLFYLINRPRPILFQQPRHRSVRQQPSAGLTPRAVVRLVVGVADPLYRCTADRARKLVSTVHCHAFPKGGHLLGELLPLFLPQPGNPMLERRSRGMVEAVDLVVAELSSPGQGRETSPVEDLV